MIVAIDQFDKSCWLIGNIAARRQIRMKLLSTRPRRNLHTMGRGDSECACANHCFRLERCFLAAGMARAVDRGQFENVPDHVRAWFKGCATWKALHAAILPTDIEPTTTYAPDATGYQLTACGGRCRRRRSFETPVTR